MSVRSIEAEVYIQSGVEAEVQIGREIVKTVYEEPVLEPLSVTANGTYEPEEGVDGFSDVSVQVPERQPVTESLSVTENGMYEPTEGIDGYDRVSVAVPERVLVTERLTATSNGTYEPDSGVDGYDHVTVNVPERQPDIESLVVTSNGTYTSVKDGYNPVTVAVPPTVPDIEPLTVTANGVYTAEGDGFNPVTVNVEAPKDPNICEGEFEGTETGVLTIDTGYEGDGYPKAIMIYDADGIIKDDAPLAYTISAFMALKSNGDTPTYSGDTSENQWRHQTLATGGSRTYASSSSSASYICTQTAPTMGATTSIKMPYSHTLKVYVTESTTTTATRFRVGIRYKYKVFY